MKTVSILAVLGLLCLLAVGCGGGSGPTTPGGYNEKEPNDYFATAQSISLPQSIRGRAGGTDRFDFFKFEVKTGQEIKVILTFEAEASFQLFLYNPDQEWVDMSSFFDDSPQIINHILLDQIDYGGEWFVRVEGCGESYDYSLQITVSWP